MVRVEMMASLPLICQSATESNHSTLAMCSTQQTDCQANDLANTTGYSVDDCCNACQSHAGCGAAVFVQGGDWGNNCYLKSSCNPVGGCVGDSCTVVIMGSPSPTPSPTPSGGNWYDGIDSIKVMTPDTPWDWWNFYLSMRQAQFSDSRYAFLLTRGNYGDAQIGVGYYTSIIGVGSTRNDVVVESFYSLDLNDDGSGGGATQNFWRSVEGVTATGDSLTWATSQACPIRRSEVQGDLTLSLEGPPHFSSGGYIGDLSVKGKLDCGTQQQFFFRNSRFNGEVSCSGLTNGVFMGTVGDGNHPSQVTPISTTPEVAEKPFLVENNGEWHIAVPNKKSSSRDIGDDSDVSQIPMDDVFVAQAKHSADEINAGIRGKRALLLTPGIYDLDHAILVYQSDFVVLGIGFPTLVSRNGNSAVVIGEAATNVRLAMVLLEAGSTSVSQATEAMLLWKGSHGVGSDIFSRVGAFPGRGCAVTRADSHVQIVGSNTILDNTWLWHADHDACGGKSDQCTDQHGLLVDGDAVTAYGLKVEHTYKSLVHWNGNAGSVYFYQSELPYYDSSFGSDGFAGYFVDPSVTEHHGVALGVYIIFDQVKGVTAFRVPAGVDLQNIVGWVVTEPDTSQFENLICIGSQCYSGDCSGNKCRMGRLPSSAMTV